MRFMPLALGTALIGLALANPDFSTSRDLDHALAQKHKSPNKALQMILNGSTKVLLSEEIWATPWEGRWQRPTNLEWVGGLYNADKRRKWTSDEVQANAEFLNQITQEPAAGGANFGAIAANWVNRGPYNKPGCFSYADLDSTDNTLWAMSCGHYGGTHSIFKGSLTGDDFKLVTGNLPSRFNDMAGVKLGTGKRLLVTTEAGAPYYTDNDGSTWQQPTGLPTTGIKSLTVNRAGGYTVYATDGQKVYSSSDTGRTYTVLQDFGTSVGETKLFAIRYGKQPGAGNLYLARNGTFYKWNGTTFAQRGTYPAIQKNVNNNGWGRFEIQGDTRRLYLHAYNVYYVSTNEGTSWTSITPASYYYNDLVDVNSERMISDHTFGVHPENPSILIGGYSDWLISKDGGISVTPHYSGWGYYQGFSGANDSLSVLDQNQRTRVGHHPDLGGSMFFYDKNGAVVSLRASDGGLYRSYTEWTLSSWGGQPAMQNVYYNITLFGVPSQETYLNSMASGSKNINHISWGTQDQGDQSSYFSTGTMLNVLQNPGGDGRSKVTGDGLTAFSFGDNAASAPTAMYSGTKFVGTRNMGDNNISLGTTGVKDLYVDITAPSTSFWSIGENGVSYHVWNGSSYTNTNRNPGGSGRVYALAQAKSATSTLYAVRGSSVYKSTNKGSTWGSALNWGGSPSDNCGIEISPVNPSQVLVACKSANATRAAYTTDGGSTWTNVSTGLPNSAISDVLAEKTGRFFFAASGVGPYMFDTQTLTWTSLGGTSAPRFQGMSMEYLNPSNTMRFSTWGQGTWDLQIQGLASSSSSGTSSSSSLSSSSVVSSSSQMSSSSSVTPVLPKNLNLDLRQWSRSGTEVIAQGEYDLSVLNLDGREIYRGTGVGSGTHSWTQQLSPGAWIVEIRQAQGMKRWMIQVR